jgi:hypothetical protein
MSPCKGGVDATSREYREASFVGADGVVASDERFRNDDHPVSALLWWLRDFFLMAQPPLLCKEGNIAYPSQFVHTFIAFAKPDFYPE